MRFVLVGRVVEIDRRQDSKGSDYFIYRILTSNPASIVNVLSRKDGISEGDEVEWTVDVRAALSRSGAPLLSVRRVELED